MERLIKHLRYSLILTGLLFSIAVKADVWDNPKIKTYYSENKEFKLVISPLSSPEKYNLWRTYKNNRHPQTRRVLRKKEKFMQNLITSDTILIPCTAELYRVKDTDSISIWKRTLLNYVCPVHAIVANDGSSIATFDNWYSTGYGVNVFVVYDEAGNAKKTYRLDEISPFPLNDYQASISSLYWRDRTRYIDHNRIEITFVTEDDQTSKRNYNVKRLDFDPNERASKNQQVAMDSNPNYDKSLAEKLGGDDYGMKSYFLVILKTGTNATTDQELIRESFRGHLDNINKLVSEEKMVVAGPLGSNDKNYRGIFILNNIASIEEAKEVLQTDPAINNGLLDYEIFTWYGSAALLEYLPAADKIWKLKP